MRRHAIAGSLLVLSGLLLPTPLPQGRCDPETRDLIQARMTRTASSEVRKPAIRRQGVPELAAILDKTDSKDTFLVTVMVLRKMGKEAREALPAIIRNAERLGLLQGIADGICRKAKGKPDTRVSAVTEEICEAMLEIAGGARESKQENSLSPALNYVPAPPPPATESLAPLAPAPGSSPVNPPLRIPAPAPRSSSWSAPTVPLIR